MRVSCDILEDFFRSGEGLLGVNDPILFPTRRDVAHEGISHPKWFEGGKELQLTGIESLREIIEKQATKQTRQDGDRQEEIGPTGDPSRAIRGNAAAWNDAMLERAWPQVWSTAKNPICAPRCLGSAAMVRNVSAVARNRML